MLNPLHTLINFRFSNPKQLFMTDAAGAVLSAVLLGLVIAQNECIFGMSRKTASLLALLACLFSVYSTLCFLFVKNNPVPFIRIIAVINLLYCLLTLGLVIFFYSNLTKAGLLYFIAEIAVILVLVRIEFKSAEAMMRVIKSKQKGIN